MSAISSYFSSANVYQAVDRNSFAHSSEAIGGTKQTFAETEEEASHRGNGQNDNPDETPAMLAAPSETPATTTTDYQHVLNVTA